jgi:phosphonate C-P lyase system protein PhnG
MTQGRMGGTGNAFNMGEMTVTRCSVRLLACGTIGHGYIQGRNKMLAQVAAICDALLQTNEAAPIVRDIIQPLQARLEEDAAKLARQSAAPRSISSPWFGD